MELDDKFIGFLFTASLYSSELEKLINSKEGEAMRMLYNGETQKVLEFLECVPDISGSDFLFNNTYINCATENDDYEVTRYCLERGADPNVVTDTWCCPLVNAVVRKNRKMVELLLDHGARVNVLYFFIDRLLDYGDKNLIDVFIKSCNIDQLKVIQRLYPELVSEVDSQINDIMKDTFGYSKIMSNVDTNDIWNNVLCFI